MYISACVGPEKPANGHIVNVTKYEVVVVCESGYNVDGQPNITLICQDNTSWSQNITQCTLTGMCLHTD